MKRYQKTQAKNVRKDTKNGRFEAYKTINGKRYSEYFKHISEAKAWVKQFHPAFSPQKKDQTHPDETFEAKYKLYRNRVNPRLALSTQDRKDYNISIFMPFLSVLSVDSITPKLISDTLEELKKTANESRYSFKDQLKELKAFYNWLIDHDETDLAKNPVRKYHLDDAFVKEKPLKKKYLEPDELARFFENVQEGVYKDIAYFQLLTASRIQEVAGLQKSDIDLNKNQIEIKHVVMWGKNKRFLGLKNTTKNGKSKLVLIGDIRLKSILKDNLNKGNSPYLFTINDEHLSYRSIQYEYNKALKKAGVQVDASTHFLRTTMAKMTNNTLGSIDAVQVVLGHDDIKMSRHYAGLNQNLQLKAQLNAAKSLMESVQE